MNDVTLNGIKPASLPVASPSQFKKGVHSYAEDGDGMLREPGKVLSFQGVLPGKVPVLPLCVKH